MDGSVQGGVGGEFSALASPPDMPHGVPESPRGPGDAPCVAGPPFEFFSLFPGWKGGSPRWPCHDTSSRMSGTSPGPPELPPRGYARYDRCIEPMRLPEARASAFRAGLTLVPDLDDVGVHSVQVDINALRSAAECCERVLIRNEHDRAQSRAAVTRFDIPALPGTLRLAPREVRAWFMKIDARDAPTAGS